MVHVDILDPNNFEKVGIVKPIREAWKNGDWIGSFNLWVVQDDGDSGALLYQQRTSNGEWAPGLLDVTAGGHYDIGEDIREGLREVREELGKDYEFSELTYLGKKLYLNDRDDYKRRYAVDVFIVRDNSPLASFQLERAEIDGLYRCNIEELIKVNTMPGYTFPANGIRFAENGTETNTIQVRIESFPYNWDNYHFKMALLAKRFINGETNLLY